MILAGTDASCLSKTYVEFFLQCCSEVTLSNTCGQFSTVLFGHWFFAQFLLGDHSPCSSTLEILICDKTCRLLQILLSIQILEWIHLLVNEIY